jgi:uncharacterized protein (DUF488 family)
MTLFTDYFIKYTRSIIFTVGHSTLPIERFIALLQGYGIELLVDIRSMPGSRRHPQFGAAALAESLAAAGIAYLHMPGLGGLRKTRADSINAAWRNKSFRGYADYMQTPEFRDAIAELIEVARDKRVALMCAEAVPWRCHRSLVADALVALDIPVVEILSETNSRNHQLTAFAHVDGTQVFYPQDASESLELPLL